MIPKDAPTSAEPRVSSHGQNDKGSGSYGLTVRGRIGLALAALTLVTFWRAKDAEFINFDDSEYITSNPYVLQGLTLKSIGWAFSSGYACNWHPLTWFSHMMDVSLFGPSAGGPHMVNVLLHTANVVLLFFVLNRMTGSKWRSATVAALFAVHPLHVESVAWVSERKDVLSALFFMLTVMAYAKYVQSSTTTTGAIQTPTPKLQTSGKLQTPSSAADPLIKYSEARVRLRWYSVALLLFALGLMSKPMLVTLPFVLLLLDFWPLNRFRFETLGQSKIENRKSNFLPLVLEKVPFFLLSAGSSVITFIVQREGGAVSALTRLPFSDRILNAILSYARYTGKMFWPVPLAVPYPYGGHFTVAEVSFAVALLAGASAIAWLMRGGHPYVAVGWAWFVGMLVPVIGIVQVGSQSLADRYTYLPSIGLFIIIVWCLGDFVAQGFLPRWGAAGLGIAVVGALGVLTFKQIGYWQNSGSLFAHSIAVTKDNYVALENLGLYCYEHGRLDEAMQRYQEALKINPNDASTLNKMGSVYVSRNDYGEASKCYQAALALRPDFTDAHNNLGVLLKNSGNLPGAIQQYQEALKFEPDNAEAHNNLANAYSIQGKRDEAIVEYRKALECDPGLTPAFNNLAQALAAKREYPQALACYKRAVQLRPHDPSLRENYGDMLTLMGRNSAAVQEYRTALALAPDDPEAHFGLGRALSRLGARNEALLHLSEAVRLRPDDADAKRELEQLSSTNR